MRGFLVILGGLFLLTMGSSLVWTGIRPFRPFRRALKLRAEQENGELIETVPNRGPGAKILRQIDTWACVSGCGACCKLGPMSSRPDIGEYLSEQDLETYKGMVGEDDWCINFDQEVRKCKIYETRPNFCQVSLPTFQAMYGIEEYEFVDFCGFCCREHITDVYGDSTEMDRFEDVLMSIEEERAQQDSKGDKDSKGSKEGAKSVEDDG